MLYRKICFLLLILSLVVSSAPGEAQKPATPPPPLISAILDGDGATVQTLLNQGAKPDTRYEGRTALMAATSRPNLDITRMLVEKGADIEARDQEGITALMFAAGFSTLDTVKFLLEKGADPGIEGKMAILQWLMEKDADLAQTQLEKKETPLMRAAQGHLPHVQLLLKRKANPKLKTPDGQTALDLAKANKHTAVVNVLKKAMAKK